MVNGVPDVQLARQACGGVAILDAQLAPRAVAIGVDRGLRHAEFAGDLLGRQVLVDEAQAFALAGGEQPHGIVDDVVACSHGESSKRRLASPVYFKAKIGPPWASVPHREAPDMDQRDPGRAAQLELAIGARMRARRRQLGLSQSDLADRLGVSFQQVQKYERGANRVAATTLLTAAQALNVGISWLVGEDAAGQVDEGDEHVFRALARPGALELLEAFNAIPNQRTRQALLALAREMAGSSPI
jgi:transcriptional regulator with XRE-family HTH domain